MERVPSVPRRPPAAAGPALQAGSIRSGPPGPASPAAAAAAGRFQRHLFGEVPPAPLDPARTLAPFSPAATQSRLWDLPPCTAPAAGSTAGDAQGEQPDTTATVPSGPMSMPVPGLVGGYGAVDAWPAAGDFAADPIGWKDSACELREPEPAMAPPEAIAPRTEPVPPPGIAAQPGARHRDGESPRERDPERGHRTTPATGTALPAAAAPAWLQDTVQRIAWLCSRADPAFQSWSVTVPMDPAVLPDSEVALSLSPYAMHLRFRTGSPESAHLISLHRDPLRAQLEALGPGQRGIDIDLEPLP